jgi:hypothetical protein
MRNSGDPELKKLAYEISKYQKVTSVPLTALGEVVHVNPRTDKVTTYRYDGKTVKSEVKITKLLENIQSKGSTKPIRDAATRDLAMWDQIRAAEQSNYLAQNTKVGVALERASKSNGRYGGVFTRSLEKFDKSLSLSTALKRSAGRIAFFVSVGVDVKGAFETEYAYRTGRISYRQRNVILISALGGIAGAMSGASLGASMGSGAGVFGGPLAWLTVPAGAIIGGAIGGASGYFGGSQIAKLAADAWYSKIDKSVLQRAEMAYLRSSWQ